jgi:hypothetical protein
MNFQVEEQVLIVTADRKTMQLLSINDLQLAC